ncbi:MAG: LON peptidase substrate-binding domain-containing protein [Paracoccaceae bacterium]
MFRGDLPEIIPVFPLPGALLLPRARLPLHIFEPRYLAMLDDVLKSDARLIGMVQPRDTHDRDTRQLHTIGCAGRVTGFSETGDGRYMITLTGVSRFRIRRELSGFSPYLKADVGWQDFPQDRGGAERDPDFHRAPFLRSLRRYFDLRQLSTDWSDLSEADDETLINALSMLCPFEPEDKQALLEAPSLTTRRETLVTLIEYALRSDGTPEVMQ